MGTGSAPRWLRPAATTPPIPSRASSVFPPQARWLRHRCAHRGPGTAQGVLPDEWVVRSETERPPTGAGHAVLGRRTGLAHPRAITHLRTRAPTRWNCCGRSSTSASSPTRRRPPRRCCRRHRRRHPPHQPEPAAAPALPHPHRPDRPCTNPTEPTKSSVRTNSARVHLFPGLHDLDRYTSTLRKVVAVGPGPFSDHVGADGCPRGRGRCGAAELRRGESDAAVEKV